MSENSLSRCQIFALQNAKKSKQVDTKYYYLPVNAQALYREGHGFVLPSKEHNETVVLHDCRADGLLTAPPYSGRRLL